MNDLLKLAICLPCIGFTLASLAVLADGSAGAEDVYCPLLAIALFVLGCWRFSYADQHRDLLAEHTGGMSCSVAYVASMACCCRTGLLQAFLPASFLSFFFGHSLLGAGYSNSRARGNSQQICDVRRLAYVEKGPVLFNTQYPARNFQGRSRCGRRALLQDVFRFPWTSKR